MATALFLCFLSYWVQASTAQSISTSTPVPPLQWINLSPYLQGSTAPPPLRDVSLGYDEFSRSLVVFGGESEGGFVQSQTYLLNMNNLTWSTPSPPPNLVRTPPGRCSAVSGIDFAASNRHSFVIIGGKGSNGVALSDVWAFDFTNQFWSQVTPTNAGPAPRWGASGGIDIRTIPIQDPTLPGPNNTLYLAGGFDSATAHPLSDVWRLNMSGILSANLPDDVMASWENLSLQRSLPARTRQGGTIIGQQIVSTGGCNTTIQESSEDSSCAQQDTFITNPVAGISVTPGPCPAPRLDPVVVPNFNTFSTNFASQVFLTLGILNTTLWDDGGALSRGEIDVLDINTGSWSRIIPSPDPGRDGQPTYPSPREGAAAFSYDRALVGTARNGISDTIIFGGRDASGKYLSDVWILRSYRDSLSSSTARWSGFGDGTLRTGIDADGSGVSIQYLNTCPTMKVPPVPPSGGSKPGDPSPSQPTLHTLDTSFIHKLFAPLSLSLLLLSFFSFRFFSSPTFSFSKQGQISLLLVSALSAGAYLVGIVGFIVSFTSLTSVGADGVVLQKSHVSTPHSQAAIVFFICLYFFTPCLLLASFVLSRLRRPRSIPSDGASGTTPLRRTGTNITAEKLGSFLATPSPSINGLQSPPASPRPRTQSTNLPRRSLEGMSTDGESTTSVPIRRGFEVLNRPANRTTRQAETWSAAMHASPSVPFSRSLGEIDWLLRRRSLNAVGELDYALSMAHNAQRNSAATPAYPPSLHPSSGGHDAPSVLIIAAYVLAQVGFLGLNVITLVALWQRAPRSAFIVFLVWVILFYAVSVFVPRRLDVENHISSIVSRWRHRQTNVPAAIPSSPTPTPNPSHGPYLHPPSFTRAPPTDMSLASGGPRSAEGEDDEDDIDEDTRQRMIEAEMDRREVSIITMPKRKLWVANPS